MDLLFFSFLFFFISSNDILLSANESSRQYRFEELNQIMN